MSSPLFWLSFVLVFWGLRFVADGLASLAAVEVRRVRSGERVAGHLPVSGSEREEIALDEAA